MSSSFKIERLRGPTVKLHLDADDWQLYNADTDEELQERDYVVMDINEGIEAAVARAPTKYDFDGWNVLHKHSDWGSADTEPRAVLHKLLTQIYGE